MEGWVIQGNLPTQRLSDLVPNWLNVQLRLPLGQGLFPTLFPLLGKERLCRFAYLKSLGDRF